MMRTGREAVICGCTRQMQARTTSMPEADLI
jgi:hypothetical protein